MSINVVEGDFRACKGKYALIVSRWNSFVVESLKEGADTLRRHGINDEDITIYYAPGAFEFRRRRRMRLKARQLLPWGQ